MNAAPGSSIRAEEFGALAWARRSSTSSRERSRAQIQGGVANGLGSADYAIETVTLDRSRAAITPSTPRCGPKTQGMYAKNHPLKGLDTASFGRPTEGSNQPAVSEEVAPVCECRHGSKLQGELPWRRDPGTGTMTTTFHHDPLPADSGQAIFQLSAGPSRQARHELIRTELTFWQLRDQMLRMANALGTAGVKKATGWESPAHPAPSRHAYLATLSLGAVVVNLNPSPRRASLSYHPNDRGWETLFTFDMMLANVRGQSRTRESGG